MKGQKLWARAKEIIPGGNQLLSKRAEKYLPDLWPAYYQRAAGCEVWDLDGNHFYDFAQMGVGSCVLGYADEDVNAAVIGAIKDSSMCSLNCYEEVTLAEKMIGLHPWADMARFARTGGEACAMAVRIARASAGKTKVAFCGYHGWHDWYLAANLANESNLDGQLLPGLAPTGVPRELANTALPFEYNNIESLKALVSEYKNEIGVIIMEPRRSTAPRLEFLRDVRRIASEIGAVLIFDEVTSGFRVNLGGIHLTYGVDPDIAIFGKSIGNGFPIAAVIGRREVMDAAQSTFISSTMWTERVGYVAALRTLQKIEDEKVADHLVRCGQQIEKGWKALSDKHNLKVHIDGIPPLIHLAFNCDDALAAQTLYSQELLKRGFLFGSSVYTSLAYNEDVIDRFLNVTDEIFPIISRAVDNGDLQDNLDGAVVHAGFHRLV